MALQKKSNTLKRQSTTYLFVNKYNLIFICMSKLLSILNKILTISSKFVGFWVGIHDKTWEGKFSYESDGKSIVWKDWLDGQPNNKHNNCFGDEDCVEVGSKGKWNDQCCGKAKPYVCEKKAKTCKIEDGKLKCPKEKSLSFG